MRFFLLTSENGQKIENTQEQVKPPPPFSFAGGLLQRPRVELGDKPGLCSKVKRRWSLEAG